MKIKINIKNTQKTIFMKTKIKFNSNSNRNNINKYININNNNINSKLIINKYTKFYQSQLYHNLSNNSIM